MDTHRDLTNTECVFFNFVKFQVLSMENINMAAFWDTVSYNLLDVTRRFKGAHCFHHQGIVLLMKALCSSDTSVKFSESTRSSNPEGCNFLFLSLLGDSRRLCTVFVGLLNTYTPEVG